MANNADLAKIDLQYQQSRKCQGLRAPLNESNAASKGGKEVPEAATEEPAEA